MLLKPILPNIFRRIYTIGYKMKILQVTGQACQDCSTAQIEAKDRGSVAVLTALGLTALLGFVAIVADIGLLYAEKVHLQNAVDAAALAGVQELPGNPDSARQIAQDYAAKNGVPEITVTFEANNAKIVVTAQKKVPTYFAKIWGITQEQISASARAMMVPPTSLSGAVPLSVQEQEFIYGEQYTLKSGAGPQEKSERLSGWFGALELSGNGAKDYETDLAYGYRGTLKIGQILEVKHGNMSGPTRQGVNTRISRDTRVPRNTFEDFERDAPEIIYIPVVKILSGSGNSVHEVQIVGFAAFFLEGVEGNGSESIVKGRFIKTLVAGTKSSTSLADLIKTEREMEQDGSGTDFGLYTPKLVDH